ncbi:cysteine--tRNA ligase [Helicobacter sp. 23-1045]
MQLFDSAKKVKVHFEPIRKGEARIYLCGPTVYDNAHLGHARSAIAFDLLSRILEANGYKVIFVRNFTDIDDKIVRKCAEVGKSAEEITKTYIANYLRDMEALGVRRANLEPKVSENLEAIFKMIDSLLAKNLAYKTRNGDIYMRVSVDSKYGSLSGRADLEAQISRIGENEQKEDARDFALWKAFEEGIAYESPYSRGRPGWHIECSAMIETHLAYHDSPYSIDIHAGGSDLLFPHHENEACQSRLANGVELAKYWIHNGFVNIDGEKMSKSLGNSFFICDALKHYDGEILRYYLLNTHYRAPLHFSDDDLKNSKKRLDKLYRFKQRVCGILGESNICHSERSDSVAKNLKNNKRDSSPTAQNDNFSADFGESNAIDEKFRGEFLDALNDDMNISIALSAVDSMISAYNENFDKNPKDKNLDLAQKARGNIAYIVEILGVGAKNPIDYFHLGADSEMQKYIKAQIELRNDAKKAKNYALADKIRDDLKAKNIHLLDTKDGVIWEYGG